MNNLSRYIIALITLLIVGYLMWYFIDIVAWIMISWVLSMLGQPMMRLFQTLHIRQFRMGPTLSALLTILCYFVLFTFLIAIFVPLIIEQARNLSEVDYYAIFQSLEVPINQFNQLLIDFGVIENVSQSPVEQIQTMLKDSFDPAQIAGVFVSIIGSAGNILISIFSIIFITFFFLKEQGLFLNIILSFTPNRYTNHVRNTIDETSRLLRRYFGGILIQITIVTLVVSTGLWLMGIQNALLIGFFAALINVIPYVGPIIGAAFGVIIAISSNLGVDFYAVLMPMMLKVVLVFACMQLLDNFLLQPLIFSNSVMAHPLEIFLVILIGAKLAGVVGMVIAIPVYTIIRVILKVFLSEFQVVKNLTRKMDNPPPEEVT